MRDAETTLAIFQERGRNGLHLENVYRRLFNSDLYPRAYGRISRNDVALTKGVTGETVDGMSLRKFGRLIEEIRHERYRWTPTWSHKRPQETMRSILEAFYEPQFSDHSHGFRPGLGCDTALQDISQSWKGTKWFIESDIKGCFDNIDHSVLLSILREKVHDNRFLRHVENMLKAGYLEQWDVKPTLSGTPQAGSSAPCSPISTWTDSTSTSKRRSPRPTRGAGRSDSTQRTCASARTGASLKRKETWRPIVSWAEPSPE